MRDAPTEEIASWSVEAERISREVEAKKRKLHESMQRESTMKDVRMSDDGFGWSGWFSVVVEVQTRILPAGSDLRFGKGSGLSNGVTDPVILKVLIWNVAGLWEDSTDIFLSQISMLTDWDVLLLQECFRKLDGVNVGAHEQFTKSELVGGLRCPAVSMLQRWSGQ